MTPPFTFYTAMLLRWLLPLHCDPLLVVFVFGSSLQLHAQQRQAPQAIMPPPRHHGTQHHMHTLRGHPAPLPRHPREATCGTVDAATSRHPPLDKMHTAAAVYVSPAPTPLPPVRRKFTRTRRSHNDLGTHPRGQLNLQPNPADCSRAEAVVANGSWLGFPHVHSL